MGGLAATVAAPLIIVPMSNREVYLDRYAEPDKGFTDRDTSWWPAPYWDIDTGMAAMLMLLTAVDEGLGACFFGIPVPTYRSFRAAFGVPDDFTPIGAISFGYPMSRPAICGLGGDLPMTLSTGTVGPAEHPTRWGQAARGRRRICWKQ
jgi:nitroreductase